MPDETFKPNKINVKSSLLYFQKREHPDNDLENNYLTTLVSFDSLGYHGSGEKIRGFDKELFLNEIWKNVLNRNQEKRKGYSWTAFDINISEIINDSTYRFDHSCPK